MRVLSFVVDGWVDPALLFGSLYRGVDNSVWLDSGVHAEQGMSVMGWAARTATASVTDGTVTADGRVESGTIFDFLRRDLDIHRVPHGPGFRLGWVGWLGYELRAQTMKFDNVRRSRYPDAAFLFLDRAVVFDHLTATVTVQALGERWTGELLSWRNLVVAECARIARDGGPEPEHAEFVGTPTAGAPTAGAPAVGASGVSAPTVSWAYPDADYLDMIRSCQDSITAGDAYQLCLTTEASIDVHPDPLDTYLLMRRSSPTHHGAFLRLAEVSLLSATPEQFIAVSPEGEVSTKPIKGTRRRGASADEDQRLRDELEGSDKERAENLMIVDLMRNDIARVAEVGSVRVTSLLAVESYAQVHQLVSTIRGTLAEGVGGMDAVEACFPAGSMTGAPKRSAIGILDRLERRARGIYSGAFGYFALDGSIDLAMVIRSIVLDPEGATIGTGGGITALSVPEEELDEVYLKAAALLRVLGVETPVHRGLPSAER